MWAICFFLSLPLKSTHHPTVLFLFGGGWLYLHTKISHQLQKQINLLLNAFIKLNGQNSVTFCF